MNRDRLTNLAAIALTLCVLPHPTFAQLDPDQPPFDPLNSLDPGEAETPPPLFDTIDRLTIEMGLALRESDTRVVWLVDRSASLRERREQIARMIPAMTRAAGRIGPNDLEIAVAGYGAGFDVFLHLHETRSDIALERLAHAFREIPTDDSGKENIFSALIRAADSFAGREGNPLGKEVLFFVVTDEPGNDTHRLDEAIVNLNQSGVRCFVAGHVTPFMSLKQFVPWTHDDGFTEDVSLDAGSETALLHRVYDLPFSPVDSREIPSGFGPWPLTRLCAATGGSYLADWSEYKTRYNEADLDKYAPDTSRSGGEFEAEARFDAATGALIEAARLAESAGWRAVPLEFSPVKHNLIEDLLMNALRPAAVAEFHLQSVYEQLLSFDDNPGVFPDARRRADYELSFARVRAARIRLAVCQLKLISMARDPQPLAGENDVWRLVPAPIGPNPRLLFAARLAEAHLHHVIDQYPGTPWAAVARSELSVPLGWKWQQATAD